MPSKIYTGSELRMIMIKSNMKTRQQKVSIPIINRYINMIKSGSVAPNIKVCGNIIIEGNHRYIAGFVCGVIPKSDPYIDNKAGQAPFNFSEIYYDTVDWGNSKR